MEYIISRKNLTLIACFLGVKCIKIHRCMKYLCDTVDKVKSNNHFFCISESVLSLMAIGILQSKALTKYKND